MTTDATHLGHPAPEPPEPPESSGAPDLRVRRVAVIAGVVVAAFGAVYLGTAAAGSSDLPAGTSVLGVDLGGMSREQAVAELTRATSELAAEPLDATVGRLHVTLQPVDAGLALDAAATVDQGLVSRWNPLSLLGRGARDLPPVLAVDGARLSGTLRTIAADTDQPVQEPSIVFDGLAPRLTGGEDGTALDQPAAAEAVTAAYLRTDVVTLPVRTVEPIVARSAAKDVRDRAAAAVAAPVTLRAGGVTAAIPPRVLAASLTYAVTDGELRPVLDGERLRAAIAPDVAAIESPGRDARWRIRKQRPVLVPSKVGRGVAPDELATSVAGVLDRTGSERVVDAVLGPIEPSLTTEQARALGITERLSTFTQHYPYAAYRSQNIGQAAKYIDGTLLEPGDTFSMNDTIKERTVANGYTTGFVVGPGGVFQEDLGGGVSTATTAVWTAAFFAGMERVHTQAHSIWISRYQAGLEATVAWGFFDMQFRNDTPHGVLITTRMTPTSITVSMWGTKVYDRVRDVSGPRTGVVRYRTVYDPSATCHAQSGVDGFSIVVTRVFVKDHEVVRREPIRTRYVPSPQVVCGKDPSKKPAKPKPDPSASSGPSASADASKPSPKPS